MPTKPKKSFKDFFYKLWHNFQEFRSHHPVIYAVTIFLIAIVASFVFEKCLRDYYNHFLMANLAFSLKRLALVGVVTEIIFLTLAFGKQGAEFVYKYRYLLGAGLFVLCVAMRINYSSAGMLDGIIQPNHSTQTDDIVTGISRGIRTDEYVVITSMIMSQYRNGFGLVNPDMMANDVITSLHPKLPNKTLLTLLTTPQYIGFVFLPFENAYSFYQLLPWFVAFFAVLEMLMVLTKKRKLMSSIGSLFIIFSPVTLWFDSIQYIMYVALLFDIFHLFIQYGKTWKLKLAFSGLFGWIGACFVMLIYPAWQVPYGYVLLALLISLIVSNRKQLKWRDLLYALPAVVILAALVVPNILGSLEQYRLTTQTIYPGQRSETGGGGLAWIFYSISSIFFPLREVANPCEASGFICLFPIPILLGIYKIFRSRKEKQHDPLLISLVVLSIFFAFMYFVGNGFIAKLTLLFLTPAVRLRPVLELVCLLIMIRLLAVYQETKTPQKPALLAIITAIISALLVRLGAAQIADYAGEAYMSPTMICVAFVVYYIAIYCLLDNRKQTGHLLGAIALLFASYQFLTIHPLRTGLDVYTDKPVATKIRELSAENQDALWLASGSTLASYAVANDARVINSVNYYPVIDRWRLLDPEGKSADVYNRFAHISVMISSKEPTSFRLQNGNIPDAFELNLNYKDVCLLDPTYFLSDREYNNIPGWSKKLIYNEDGMYIYQLDCTSN